MLIDESVAAVVTGGASGLGRATVEALRAKGAKVAIFDLDPAAGAAVAAELGATFCAVDVSDEGSVDAGFAAARAANGQERILVNCAGTARRGKTVNRHRETGEVRPYQVGDFAWVLGVNTVGTFSCIVKSAAGMMALDPDDDGGRGAIVNTGSVAAEEGQIGQVAYAASKAAIKGMTLVIARDLSGEGIRINTILPGIMATPPLLKARAADPEGFAKLERAVPFPRRAGRPDEFADLALMLLGNDYMNGETVRIDGAIRMAPR